MRAYPCLAYRAKAITNMVQCQGTMHRVRSDHKGKQKFVCNTCERVGFWWETTEPSTQE